METRTFRMKKNQAVKFLIEKPTVVEFARGTGGHYVVTFAAPPIAKIEPEDKSARKGKKYETSD